MKLLNKEEAAQVEPIGKGKYNWLYKKLALIDTGEGIIIRFSDWKTKTKPYVTIKRAAKNLNRKFIYGLHPDGSGWLVKRVG